jgi:hypothetical protein
VSEGRSRIEEARLRAAGAKQLAVAAAVAGFLVALLLARASHPGQAASSHLTSRSTGSRSDSQDDGSLQFGQSYVAPSANQGAPEGSTHVS